MHDVLPRQRADVDFELQAALDAHLFDDIIRLPDSCGVDEAEGMVADGECGINGVARSALNVADNGSVVVDDGIEECALSDIGAPMMATAMPFLMALPTAKLLVRLSIEEIRR